MSFVVAVLAVLIQATALPAAPARAAGARTADDSPFQSLTYQLLDSQGNPLVLDPEHPVDKDSELGIRFDFTLRNDLESIPADYTFTVPKEIQIADTLTLDLKKSEDSPVYATATIAPGGEGRDNPGTIHFTDQVLKESNISGHFTVYVKFDEKQIENKWPVELPFTFNNVADPVEVYFELPAPAIQKDGRFEIDNEGRPVITWHVTINGANPPTTVRSGVLTDAISAGQTFVAGSFHFYTDSSYAKLSDAQPDAARLKEPAANDGKLQYDLGGTSSQTIYAAYQTTVDTDHLGQTLGNTASLAYTDNGGDAATVSDDASVSTDIDFIGKSGRYDAQNKEIVYTITLNPKARPITGATVTDTLPASLTLSGVFRSDDAQESDAAAVPKASSGTQPYYEYNGTSRQLTYHAFDTLKGSSQTLYVHAKLPDDYFQRNDDAYNFTNTAVISGTGIYSGQDSAQTKGDPGPASTVLKKSADGAHSSLSGQIITWHVTVGSDAAELPGAVLQDVIDPGNTNTSGDASACQTYVKGSFQFTASAPSRPGKNTISPIRPPSRPTWPRATIPCVSPIKATLTLSEGGPSTARAVWSPTSDVLKKRGISYDYDTRTATWQIDVNNSQAALTQTTRLADQSTLKGVLVEDDLGGLSKLGFGFDADSLTVTGGGTFTRQTEGLHLTADGSALPDAGHFSYDDATGRLWINLGQLDAAAPADRSRSVQFSMTLAADKVDAFFGTADANGKKTISNTAALHNDQKDGTTASGPIDIQNQLVGKKADYTPGKDYIDWSVALNQNSVRMQGVTLTDSLQEGLELDTSSVALYPQTRASDGTLTPAKVPADVGAFIHYDAGTRVFTYTVPGTLEGPYLLRFRTYVDAAHHNASFQNQASLSGDTIEWQSGTVTQKVAYNTSDTGITGQTGSITVTKRDA